MPRLWPPPAMGGRGKGKGRGRGKPLQVVHVGSENEGSNGSASGSEEEPPKKLPKTSFRAPKPDSESEAKGADKSDDDAGSGDHSAEEEEQQQRGASVSALAVPGIPQSFAADASSKGQNVECIAVAKCVHHTLVVLQSSGIMCSDILAGESTPKPLLSSARSSASNAGGFKFSVVDPLEVLSTLDEDDAHKPRGLEAHIASLRTIAVKKNVDTVAQAQHEASASVPSAAVRCFFCKKTPQDISVSL